MTRVPHGDSPVEVRQAFQRLIAQGNVITTGTSGYLLVAQGVGVTPVWQTIVSTIDHGSIGGLGDDDHGIYHTDARGDARYFRENEHLTTSAGAADEGKPVILDSDGDIDATMINDGDVDHGGIGGLGDDDHTIYLLADGSRALGGNWSLGSNDLTSVGLYGGVDVPEMNQFFNGTFQETFDALVTSDGSIITMSLEQSGTGDLTMQFSDGYTILDCTDPLQTIALTAGAADTSPQGNYIYVLKSTKALTKSTSSWPAEEHIRVAYFLVPSAVFVASNGCYVNQNCNDHLMGTDSQGHMSHMTAKLRRLGATWYSGVNANGATASYFTIGANTTHWLSTLGKIDQLHEHTYPAVETSGSDVVLVVNQNGTAYDKITDLYSITNDSTGDPIGNNKYFNLVFWGVVNKSGEFAALMVNLPGGFYTRESDALIDADGHDVYDIPREFSIDSGTAFLICRATFKMGSTWTHSSTTDLRGLTPATASGSSVNDHGGLGGLTDVADHLGYLLIDGSRNLAGNMSVDAAVTIDGRDISSDGTALDTLVTDAGKVGVDSGATVDFLGAASNDGALRVSTGISYADGGNFVTLTTNDGQIVHDNLSGYDANDHIDHATVSISSGTGLSGGGTIDGNQTLALDINGLSADTIVAADTIAFYDDTGGHVNKTTFANFKTALAIHAESHDIVSHSDTSATGTELNTLTDDSMADALHRHSELSASDGTPNPALSVNASGIVSIGTTSTNGQLVVKNSGNDTAPLSGELVTNGNFASDISSWTVGDGGGEWSWDATGKAQHNTGNTSTFYQGIAVTNELYYYVEFTTSSRTAGSVVLSFGAMLGSRTASGNSTYNFGFKATSTATVNLTFTPTSTWDGRLDDVLVKQITGGSDVTLLLESSDGQDAIEIRTQNAQSNTLIGTNAGRYIVSGNLNLAVGKQSLFNNVSGGSNLAIGISSLKENVSGNFNLAVGTYALEDNETGSTNLAVGAYALNSNTIGNYNTAVGENALRLNTTGIYNMGVARFALYSNVSGDWNMGLGPEALYSITVGDRNAGIGYRAGRFVSDGGANQTTNNSVYIGYETRASADGADNEVVIGYLAIGKGANTMMLGGSTLTTVFVPALAMLERSSDPTEPAEGECVVWLSDGSGKGDDGDIMAASKAGGTTNYGTLFDHSGGAAW